MFVQKYRPVSSNDIIGNKNNINNLIEWLNTWNENNKYKCALISGNSGIGKTLSIEIILKELKFNIIELNTDDERDKSYIQNNIKQSLNIKKTVFNKSNILVVNDLDCCNDYGFLTAIVECIKETKIPIICTCNDRYNQNLKTLTNYCIDVKFTKPPTNEIVKFINNIIKKENININQNEILELIENSNNDIRNILNTLQLYTITRIKSNNNEVLNKNKDNTQLNLFDLVNTKNNLDVLFDFTPTLDFNPTALKNRSRDYIFSF
jgi:replication factor C subunit 1